MMKNIIPFFIILGILVSCWKKDSEEASTEDQKIDFYVETTLWNDFIDTISLKKVGQVKSSQDISLSSNANGRVSRVYVKAGDSVYAGQTLASLEDNIGSYGINLSRASNGVERAKINYESTELSLDKSIFDAQLNLEKLERNLVALESDSEQNLLLAEDTLENSKYSNLDSSSALRLESIDNAIEKSKLDYEIKLSSDQQTIEWYKATLKKEFSSLLTTLIDVQEFSDSLLGVTEINKDENNDFEYFLGSKDSNQKRNSELALESLIDFRESEEFQNTSELVKNSDISEKEMIQVIDFIDEGYDETLDLLNKLEVTLNNSTTSEGNFWKAEIGAFVGSINGYQAWAQWSYGAYISISSSMKNFLNTYENSQTSLLKSIELQEKDREIQYTTIVSSNLSASAGYERTVIGTQDNISNLKDQVASAQKTLDNAIKNKDVTLRSLKNSISEAQIWYASSAKEYGKLTITSPISGTIWEVYIDAWQELFSGNTAFDIVSNGTPEVEVALSRSEKELVTVDTQVQVVVGEETLQASIYAISQVADDNLNYKTTIIFESGFNIIGNIVSVNFLVPTDKMLLPINTITTLWDDMGSVKTLSGSTFADVRVRIWEVFWEYIEVVSCAKNCVDLQIITSDVSNFDENKFTILEK